MIEDLAVRWYQAEKLPTDPSWFELPVRRQDEIRKRVKLVLEGEVRKSECSAGDLAVWFGRFRELKAPVIETEHELTHRVFYDSLDIVGPSYHMETQHHTRLFGNYNIGNYNKCNIQVAGCFYSAGPFHLMRTWISVPVEDDLIKVWDDVLGQTTVTYCVGDRPQLELPGRELWSDPHAVSIHVPFRQNASVEAGFYGTSLERLKQALRGRDPERGPVRLYVFVEGFTERCIA